MKPVCRSAIALALLCLPVVDLRGQTSPGEASSQVEIQDLKDERERLQKRLEEIESEIDRSNRSKRAAQARVEILATESFKIIHAPYTFAVGRSRHLKRQTVRPGQRLVVVGSVEIETAPVFSNDFWHVRVGDSYGFIYDHSLSIRLFSDGKEITDRRQALKSGALTTREIRRRQMASMKTRDLVVFAVLPEKPGRDEVGVSAWIAFRRTAAALPPAKYLTFYVTPFNRVGDPLDEVLKLRATGPFDVAAGPSPDTDTTYYWDGLWTDKAVDCLYLNRVDIIYLDGTSASYSGASLEQAIFPDFENSCSWTG